MGTSKSSEPAISFVGGASVFSGRPDPEFPLEPADAERLLDLWNGMEQLPGFGTEAPVLGYRGCYLRDTTNRVWFAYGGVVTLATGNASDLRGDTDREFESTLLSLIPKGAIPPGIIPRELIR